MYRLKSEGRRLSVVTLCSPPLHERKEDFGESSGISGTSDYPAQHCAVLAEFIVN
jgi:hypothetical protein